MCPASEPTRRTHFSNKSTVIIQISEYSIISRLIALKNILKQICNSIKYSFSLRNLSGLFFLFLCNNLCKRVKHDNRFVRDTQKLNHCLPIVSIATENTINNAKYHKSRHIKCILFCLMQLWIFNTQSILEK